MNCAQNPGRPVPGVEVQVRRSLLNPSLGKSLSKENGMKDATRRAASEALAQMMAVTAMLVIASVVLYVR
jgi:hypothetical protein